MDLHSAGHRGRERGRLDYDHLATNRAAPPPERAPAVNPYEQALAAAGIVEASTRNVRVAPPEPGLITKVFVSVNQAVKSGDALFELDARAVTAELERACAAVQVAESQLARLESMPRPEDVAPLKAVVERCAAQLATAQVELESIQGMRKQNAASDLELRKGNLAVDEAKARLKEAQAELDRMLAGAWTYEIAVAKATLEQARADVRAIDMRLQRLTVRSPIDGIVLKRLIEPGEYSTPSAGPAMQVGDLSTLHVRRRSTSATRRSCGRALVRRPC